MASINNTTDSFRLFNENTEPLLAFLSVVCFLVNLTIIALFLIDPLHSLRRPSGYLVAGLNAGAVLTSVSSLILSVQNAKNTIFLSVNVFFVIFSVAATASFVFIYILSCERYALVTSPIKYKRVVTVRLAVYVTISVWIFSAFIGVFVYKLSLSENYIWLSLPFAVAFALLIVVDIKTFVEIKKVNSTIDGMTGNGSERSSASQAIKNRIDMQSKFARVVVLLLLNFIFLACPLFLVHSLFAVNKSCDFCLFSYTKEDKFYAAGIILFIFHDIHTALFYLILIPKYRLSFVAVLKKCGNAMPDMFTD